MRLPRTIGSVALACAPCVMALAGCGKSSSHPTAPPPATREVAATVEDTTGARVPGRSVLALHLDVTSFGPDDFKSATTDLAGVAHFALLDGRWSVYAGATSGPDSVLVAGSTGQVAHHPSSSVDTVLFRLVLRPGSVARGRITLTGQGTHAGTIVGAGEFLLSFAVTAADGSYELGGLPPGTWSGVATHAGFQSRLFDLPVPFAGDTITTGTIALAPGGAIPRP